MILFITCNPDFLKRSLQQKCKKLTIKFFLVVLFKFSASFTDDET